MIVIQAVVNQLNNERIADIDRIRLVMLYALRYEKESPMMLEQLLSKLSSRSSNYNFNVISPKSSGYGYFAATATLGGPLAADQKFRRIQGAQYMQLSVLLWQLVRTLLKQAGMDKRTGDLYGNRDLFNRARNMARGLKVCFMESLCPA